VDPREVLRRYLEQRREAGETELVLDSLSVDDAMRMIGLKPGGATRERPRVESKGDVADWRSALRAADVAPAARDDTPRTPAPHTPTSELKPVDDGATVGGGRYGFTVEPSDESVKSAQPSAESARPLSDFPQGIVVGSNARELFGGADSPLTTLDELVKAVATCTACPLSREAKNPVPGEGNPNAGLVCVGEAPGATEDELGRPFVGQAGQLLTKILAAIQLAREDVYICNVLKHRPPGNRNPLPSEVEACSPYLVRQIELIKPKVIVAFGTFAAQTLLNTKEAIGKLRGRVHRYHGVPLVVTYHPAALLRNPAWKRPTWEDVQLARRLLDRASGDE
jgi:uracil-DNA glycosylase